MRSDSALFPSPVIPRGWVTFLALMGVFISATLGAEGLSVAVVNLHPNGVVHSGFVVGTAGGADVALVEFSVDGGTTFQAATGTTQWKFPLPRGAGWRDNSLHQVVARATDTAGNTALSPVLSVRQGTNLDVNGDGFAETVAGDPTFDDSRGRVYVFYSSADGSGIPNNPDGTPLDANDLESVHSKVIGGEIVGAPGIRQLPQLFGASVTLGDLNGDGYADLIVGAPAASYPGTATAGVGILYAFYAIEVAPGSALIVQGNATGAPTQLVGDNTRFLGLGTSVAVGDVTGDGVADVVAGAPGTSQTPPGEVSRTYIFHSIPGSGLVPRTVAGANATILAEASGTSFGQAVAVGDVNGDGFADVAVGANHFLGQVGRAYVFHAANDGTGFAATSATDAQTIIIGDRISQFGTSIAVGDLNGDGFPDLVVGGPAFTDPTPGGDVRRGRVYAFYSQGTVGIPTNQGIDPTNQTAGQHVIGGTIGTSEEFGASLALGDVNGDGHIDLIAGAPAGLSGQGTVYVFHGVPGVGLIIGNAHSATDNGVQINGQDPAHPVVGFGTAVATGDGNGDGALEVVAGAPGSPTLAGKVFVFQSTPGQGIPVGRTIRGAINTIFGATGGSFGSAVE